MPETVVAGRHSIELMVACFQSRTLSVPIAVSVPIASIAAAPAPSPTYPTWAFPFGCIPAVSSVTARPVAAASVRSACHTRGKARPSHHPAGGYTLPPWEHARWEAEARLADRLEIAINPDRILQRLREFAPDRAGRTCSFPLACGCWGRPNQGQIDPLSSLRLFSRLSRFFCASWHRLPQYFACGRSGVKNLRQNGL
jgi:hypothetical protein